MQQIIDIILFIYFFFVIMLFVIYGIFIVIQAFLESDDENEL